MLIRDGTIDDLFEVSILWEEMVKEMRPDWNPSPSSWYLIAVKCMDSGFYHLKVLFDNNVMVGFVDGFMFHEPSTDKLHGIGQHYYVKPAYRKRFTGGKLLNELINKAIGLGAKNIDCFCFPEEKPMWEKIGFRETRIMMRKEV